MDQHFPNVDQMVRNKQIEIAPLAFMRGRTFNDAFVLFDEAQNCTPNQMKLFLTRLGDYARVCITGDLDQKDIQGISGLEDALERHANIPEIKIVQYEDHHSVRSKLVRKFLANYR